MPTAVHRNLAESKHSANCSDDVPLFDATAIRSRTNAAAESAVSVSALSGMPAASPDLALLLRLDRAAELDRALAEALTARSCWSGRARSITYHAHVRPRAIYGTRTIQAAQNDSAGCCRASQHAVLVGNRGEPNNSPRNSRPNLRHEKRPFASEGARRACSAGQAPKRIRDLKKDRSFFIKNPLQRGDLYRGGNFR